MNPLISFLASLLADSPSMRAAMKAGQETRISAKIIRANGTVEDLGVVSRVKKPVKDLLRAILKPGKVVVRFVYRGKEIERSTY
mgnify:CR=1 FL=1